MPETTIPRGTFSRMDAIQAPIVAVIGDLIRQTPGTISLGQGIVHYGPPSEVARAVEAALSSPDTHQYNDGHGLPELRSAIKAKLRDENGIEVGGDSRIMVTAGANMAFMHAVMAITTPGDEVILPIPFYFNHEMAIQMAGCRAVRVATDDRYQLDLDGIERAITNRTRAVVTISPNNPSGAVLDPASLRAVNELCRARGLYHIADEPYEYFTYGSARHFSPHSLPGAANHTISMYSLSKAYGFASWRIGYMVVPESLAVAVNKIQDTMLICAPHVSQAAAIGALRAGRAYCDRHVVTLAGVRARVLERLSAVDDLCEVPTAAGAFYCLLRIRTPMDAMTLAERLIREHGVATVPGTTFGLTEACYLRVSYGALAADTVDEGVGRLVGGLKGIVG